MNVMESLRNVPALFQARSISGRNVLPTTRFLLVFIVVVGVVVCQVAGAPWWILLFAAPGATLANAGLFSWSLGGAVSLLFEAGSVAGWLTGHPIKWLGTFFVLAAMIGHGVDTYVKVEQATKVNLRALEQQRTVLDESTKVEREAMVGAMGIAKDHAANRNPANARKSERIAGASLKHSRKLAGDKKQNIKDTAKVSAVSPTKVDKLRPWVLAIVSPSIYIMVIQALLVLGGRGRVPVIPKRSDPTEQLAERCRTAIEAKRAGGMTYREIDAETGVSATVLHTVVNREQQRNRGEPITKHAALERCAAKLGVEL